MAREYAIRGQRPSLNPPKSRSVLEHSMVAGHASYLFNDALKRRAVLTHSAACLHAGSRHGNGFSSPPTEITRTRSTIWPSLLLRQRCRTELHLRGGLVPTGRVPLEQLLVATVWPAANSVEPRHPCKQGRAANAIDSPNREITAKPLQKKIRYCSHAK